MAVNPSPFGPKPQIELSSGVPAVGNKLFFYVAGSVNTKQNTYTSSTGLSANTNPIVLDALGQPTSTEIWFTAGQSYKVVYAPSTDTDPPTSPIWTIDNLSGINDVTASFDEWKAGPTPTYVSATSFTLVGDQTSTFTKSRRIKTTNTGGTVYSTIVSSVFGAVTTVTVANDSSTLDAGLSAVSYGLISAVNPSINADQIHRKGTAVASAATTDIWSIAGDYVHLTGATGPITSFGTAPYAGAMREVIVDSTPTITNNAVTLQCPGGGSIVCAAGDRFFVRADTTANSIITDYIRADNAASTILGNPGTASAYPSQIDISGGMSWRNRALNGDFRFDQINEGSAFTINGVGPTVTVDAVSGFGIGAAGVFTVAREQSGIYTGEYNLLVSCGTADVAIAAGDLYGVHTDIEGYDVADLLIGTATPASMTISFEVKSAVFTGTLGISVVNSAVNRCYVGTFAVNATGTIEKKTVTLTLDTTGTWLTTNGTGLRVRIALAAGSTYQGTAGAWGASNLYTTSAQSNFMSVNTNVLRVGRFQVEKGSLATPFERVPYPVALARMQRYYEKTFTAGVAVAQNAGLLGAQEFAVISAGVGHMGGIRFKVDKRAAPTMTGYNPSVANANARDTGGGVDVTVTSYDNIGVTGCGMTVDASASAASRGAQLHWTANARLS